MPAMKLYKWRFALFCLHHAHNPLAFREVGAVRISYVELPVEHVLEGAGIVFIKYGVVGYALVAAVYLLRREGIGNPFGVGVVAKLFYEQVICAAMIGNGGRGKGFVGCNHLVTLLLWQVGHALAFLYQHVPTWVVFRSFGTVIIEKIEKAVVLIKVDKGVLVLLTIGVWHNNALVVEVDAVFALGHNDATVFIWTLIFGIKHVELAVAHHHSGPSAVSCDDGIGLVLHPIGEVIATHQSCLTKVYVVFVMVETIVAPVFIAVFVGLDYRESVNGAGIPAEFVALNNQLVVYGLGLNLDLSLCSNRGHGKRRHGQKHFHCSHFLSYCCFVLYAFSTSHLAQNHY